MSLETFTDPALQNVPGSPSIPVIVLDFLGIGTGFFGYQVSANNPDANLAAGDNQVVQWVNAQFAVFDLDGNNLLFNGNHYVNGNVLFSGLPHCGATNSGSPIVQWDKIAHRWVMYQPRQTSPYYDCFAISQTADATGAYYTYEFPTLNNDTDYPDYPKVGVWPNGYYVSHNSFLMQLNYNGAMPCAYDRVKMLAGDPSAQGVCFLDNSNGTLFDNSMLPADLDSPNAPPDGIDPIFMGSIDNFPSDSNVYYYPFHFDPVNPANSTFSCVNGACKIAVIQYQPAPSTAAEPGGGTIDTLSDRLMYRLAYRRFGDDHQTWLVSHAVNANGNIGIRWYEFRSPINTTTPTVFQQGTYAPDSTARFMSSLAMDKDGNIAMGYSSTSSSQFPSIGITGRSSADPLGTMGAETIVIQGTGEQTDSPWGSYTSMALGGDECTFWYSNEYYTVTSASNWSTRIASADFPNCVPLLDTQTTISSMPNPSTYFQPVMITALVTSPGGIPTGTVDFVDIFNGNQIPLCTGVMLNGGNAICLTQILSAGVHDQILATYSGDSQFSGSQGTDSPPQIVNRAVPAFSNLTPSQSITYGTASVTLSGVICSPGQVCPPIEEQVKIAIQGQSQTALISDDAGHFSALYPTSMIPVGTYPITYSYAGDTNFNAASDSSTTLTVNQAFATIKITPYNLTYDGQPHSATGAATCGAINVSGNLNLSGTTHTNAGVYAADPWTFHDPNGNCKDANGTVADTINPALTSTVLTASPPSPSIFGQTVTFTATVTGSNGGSPTGTVNFTADNAPIAGCSAVVLSQQQNTSIAVCQTSALAVGSHTVLAAYGGDHNFKPGSGSLAYTVQAAGDFTVQVNPGPITVTQGFTNENQPFFPQTISLSATPVGDYSSSVTLSCSVAPPLSSGSCIVNAPTSGSLASGSLNTTLTISAGDTTPIGSYTVTVSAQDSNQVVHTANLSLSVIEKTQLIVMQPGGATTTQVNFPGPPDTQVGGFSCPSVSGTGIDGSEAFSAIGGVCTFTPGSTNLPAPVKVTLSGCTVPVARLRRQSPIFASVFFGLPAVVLLGPLFRRHRNQRRKLRSVVILFLLTLCLLMFGCGGSAGPLTPTGHYYVLVQGTGPGGATYSAVVPLTVTPLNN